MRPPQRPEDVARRHLAAVGDDPAQRRSADFGRGLAKNPAADRLAQVVERGHGGLGARDLEKPRAASGERAVSHQTYSVGLLHRASGGPPRRRPAESARSPMIWLVSCPLPASSTQSPGLAAARAQWMAATRSRITRAAAGSSKPSRISSAIACGSSLRGLSLVIDRQVGALLDGPAHQRPLLAVAVAAGAEDADQPPAGRLPQRLQAGGQGVGRVGEIDEHPERLAALDPLEPAPHAVDGLQAADHRGQVDAVGQAHGRGGQAVVDVVPADHPRLHRHRLAAGRQQKRLFAEEFLHRQGGDFRGRADADRQGRAVEAAADSRRPPGRRR